LIWEGRSLKINNLIKHIGTSSRLSAVLEASGWPKPGNVHRTMDHSDTRYEHFLAGSIILGSSVEESAKKGYATAKGRLTLSEIGVGRLVRKAISDIANLHNGGNTHLGTCFLFIPLAAAAAKTHTEMGKISLNALQKTVKEIMQSTTPVDAIEAYKAIMMVSSIRELGRISVVESPDLFDKQARRKILEEEISLFDVMKESSSYDTVARELVTGLEISFKIGYKELIETFEETYDINTATVHTFLRILSKIPDTFIARKIGLKKTSNIRKAVDMGVNSIIWISKKAEEILKLGGLKTKEGTSLLWEFDKELQHLGKKYSPGTTADLTASSLFIALLSGLRF
jgi:triphosphoribosyl-dephospho-CoA synthase